MPDPTQRRRSRRPTWTDAIAERLTPGVKAYVIAAVLIYSFYVFVRNARPLFAEHLALGPAFLHGELWQPVSALFVHLDPLSLVLNVLALWFTGSAVERAQGTRRLATMFFLAGVLGNVTSALVWKLAPNAPPVYEYGSFFPVCAYFMMFWRIFQRAQVSIGAGLFLQARNMVLIVLGASVLITVAQGNWGSLVGTLVASAVGYAGGGAGGMRSLWASFKLRRHRRRYKVIDGGDRPRKSYMN